MVRSEVFIPKSVFLISWQKVYFCCHTSSFLCRGPAHVTVGRHNKKQSHLALTGINNLQFLVAKPGLGPTTAKSLHKLAMVWTSNLFFFDSLEEFHPDTMRSLKAGDFSARFPLTYSPPGTRSGRVAHMEADGWIVSKWSNARVQWEKAPQPFKAPLFPGSQQRGGRGGKTGLPNQMSRSKNPSVFLLGLNYPPKKWPDDRAWRHNKTH